MEIAVLIFVGLGLLIIYLLSKDIYTVGYHNGFQSGYKKGLTEAIEEHKRLFKIINSEKAENN